MPAHAPPNRPLAYAATSSLALHALVLSLSAPALRELPVQPLSTSASIAARIVEPAPPREPIARETSKAQPLKRDVRQPVREQTAADVPSLSAASAAPARPIADANSVAQYRQQLIGVAVRYKLYPPQAVQNAWEGGVAVRVSIAAGGAPQLSVKTSSGYELLDEQVLEMFRLAAAEVPVPPALRGQDFGFEVKAVYSLSDQ